jgi:hypothetical protein
LKVVGVTLTGFLFWESCRVAIFLLIPIGIIPGNGVYGLNVCSADGTLSIGSRTSSVLMASEQSGSGAGKSCPQPEAFPGQYEHVNPREERKVNLTLKATFW